MFKLIVENATETTNGMPAYKSALSACLDLFYKAGASRGKNIVPAFEAAFQQDRDLAVRIALWARDIRGGAGERQTFRNILLHLEQAHPEVAGAILPLVPEVGRWDDLLVLQTPWVKTQAFALIADALRRKDRLCAKWMPRQGAIAAQLRRHMNIKSSKEFRKLLVSLTNVVETPMCAREWSSIQFDSVPSVAHARYRKAFQRNAPQYAAYVEGLVKGERKVNASSVFPHDVLRGVADDSLTPVQAQFVEQQWNALPAYVGSARVLPMVDVSGSMSSANVSGSVTAMDVAIAMGLYFATKATGAYRDLVLTFSERPTLFSLKGSLTEKYHQLRTANWGMNTNIDAALDQVLSLAVNNNVPQAEMPEVLLVLSDMQFDAALDYRSRGPFLEIAKTKFRQAGYVPPVLVFWNLNDAGNTPATIHSTGAVLLSGYSPAVFQTTMRLIQQHSQIENALHALAVEAMLATVKIPRYNWED